MEIEEKETEEVDLLYHYVPQVSCMRKHIMVHTLIFNIIY
jgi:hypothetical protein